MKPPGTNQHWLGIPLRTALAVAIGLLCAADALAQAAEPKAGEVLDRKFERLNPVAAGRPDLMFGRKTLTLYPGMTSMTENGFINTKAVSYTIDAELEIPQGGANGVLLSQAGLQTWPTPTLLVNAR